MKYSIIILSILRAISCSPQDVEMINAQEVLFVLAEDYNGNYFTKVIWQKNKSTLEKNSYLYNYFFKDGSKIQLSYKEFEDFDEMERDNPVLFVKINRSFLRKNKDIIITKDLMHKIGYTKSSELFYNAKKILLIERNISDNSKVIIKEVKYLFIGKE
jgi:hypothetical protein